VNGRQIAAWVPLALAIGLGAALSYGLARPDDRTVMSRMVGAAAPAFSLSPALPGRPGLSDAALRAGRPQLLNFFASWCVPCAAEAPALAHLAASGLPVVGVAVRDRPVALGAFLAAHGDPYRAIGGDGDSRVAMAFGTSGVPESFLVDGRGHIVRQVIGPIGADEARALLAAAR